MFIFIDESGSFALSPAAGSWNVVAAYAVPEADRRRVERILRELKLVCGRSHSDEVKLKHLSEQQLKRFLHKLNELESTLFVSAIDLGAQSSSAVAEHQALQVAKITVNKPRMLYAEGRALVEDLGRIQP